MLKRLSIVALLSCVACAGRTPATVASAGDAIPGRPDANFYDGSVSVNPATRFLRARWIMTLRRTPATEDSAVFRLNSGFKILNVSGRDLASHSDSIAGGDTRLTVRFTPSSRAQREIAIEYEGVPKFGSDSINGIRTDWVELALDSFWHPVITDFSHPLRSWFTVQLPSGWQLASGGSARKTAGGFEITNTVQLLDVPFTATPAFTVGNGRRAAVYSVGADTLSVPKILAMSDACAEYLDARYGAGPAGRFPKATIVLAPRGGPGYARKNYIVVSRGADTASLQVARFVCHEFAHYWSTGATPSGPENWLNEGFAEFVSGRFVRATLGDSAFRSVVARWSDGARDQGAIWTPQATRRPTARISYNKAPLLLSQLEERVGSPVMERILARFMTEPIRTTLALIAMVGDVAGAEAGKWFRAELAR